MLNKIDKAFIVIVIAILIVVSASVARAIQEDKQAEILKQTLGIK